MSLSFNANALSVPRAAVAFRRLVLFGFCCVSMLMIDSARATLTISTGTATNWVISNGTLTLDWNSTTAQVSGVYLNGVNLVDTTVSNGGLYMDNSGVGAGTVTASYHQNGDHYIDWWYTVAASGTANPFTYTQHFILTDGATGFHTYFVVNHGSGDAAGSLGQVQYVFRISQTLFDNTYSVNPGLSNQTAYAIPVPTITTAEENDPGRNVQNAVLDLHGLSLPTGFGREFETKYDYSSYEYLHQAHGVYGSTYGAWLVLPSTESLVGGPTKQDLIFTGNILMCECLSNHLDDGLAYNVAANQATNRLFGPYYFYFNQFNSTITTAAQMYQDALNQASTFNGIYDNEGILNENGYVDSTARGDVEPFISGGGSSSAYTAWEVLSDTNTNMQYSTMGREYWQSNNANGDATIYNVVPATYRLSAYVLGEWGEMRDDGVVVTAGSTTDLHGLTFVPENFGGSLAPVWTIGTPDRSAHEFLHGYKPNTTQDDREYWGNWNYWLDFEANKGACIYYATNGPGYTASNNPLLLNYVQWGNFDPGLFGGYYNSSDDTTDGYNYICPSYVGSAGTATPPAWTIHFTTTSQQSAQGSYSVLSVGVAAAEGDVFATLNGHQLIWHRSNNSDAMVRSGLSGYYEWIAFEWPTSDLSAAGSDNVLTLSTNTDEGVMYDALRFEVTPTTSNPNTTGWHDYEYINANTDIPADDAVDNP